MEKCIKMWYFAKFLRKIPCLSLFPYLPWVVLSPCYDNTQFKQNPHSLNVFTHSEMIGGKKKRVFAQTSAPDLTLIKIAHHCLPI